MLFLTKSLRMRVFSKYCAPSLVEGENTKIKWLATGEVIDLNYPYRVYMVNAGHLVLESVVICLLPYSRHIESHLLLEPRKSQVCVKLKFCSPWCIIEGEIGFTTFPFLHLSS